MKKNTIFSLISSLVIVMLITLGCSKEEKKPIQGLKTMDNMLRTAIAPMGTTMYIWGGAWNEEDTGAGVEAVTFGLSDKWAEFAAQQNENYDYNEHDYEIHNGLDCSGYIGWLVYNVLETEPNREGYVTSSTKMAKMLSDKGYGTFYDIDEPKKYTCGDIVSMNGHVWLSLGTCDDGSVLLIHSSSPGVKISGTINPDGSKSQAVLLAERFMKENYSDWYKKFPDCSVSADYLKNNTIVRFGEDIFEDANEYRGYSPEQILKIISNK